MFRLCHLDTNRRLQKSAEWTQNDAHPEIRSSFIQRQTLSKLRVGPKLWNTGVGRRAYKEEAGAGTPASSYKIFRSLPFQSADRHVHLLQGILDSAAQSVVYPFCVCGFFVGNPSINSSHFRFSRSCPRDSKIYSCRFSGRKAVRVSCQRWELNGM